MSDGVARVPVLPRKVAAGVTLWAVTRAGWGIAGLVYVVAIAGLISIFVREQIPAALIVEPLCGIGIMVVALALLIARPGAITMVTFLVLSGVGDYLWVQGIAEAHPILFVTAIVLVNRPDTVIPLTGTYGDRPLPAIAWGLAGFVIALAATIIPELQAGIPIALGLGPAITLVNYCAVYLALSIVQRYQRQRIPDFLQLRQETRRMEDARTSQQRAVALIHDTLLNDLALVVNGPEILDVWVSERMLKDVETLATTNLFEPDEAPAVMDASDGLLRNNMTQVVSDFQWRGLNVDLTGDTTPVVHMSTEAVRAAVGALRACLENVLAHSGVHSAEIIVSATNDSVTWTVSDAGKGFDQKAVPADRLGLTTSVIHRVESAGGVVKIWSRPDHGTSVIFSLPQLVEGGGR